MLISTTPVVPNKSAITSKTMYTTYICEVLPIQPDSHKMLVCKCTFSMELLKLVVMDMNKMCM